MGGKSNNGAPETPQQRALTDFAVKQMADYKSRWLPVQRQLAAQIQAAGAEDSAARRGAAGKASTDAAMSFATAEGALSKTLANSGAGVGSSKGKLAITGMGEDKAKTTGLGAMMSDQQIDDAYTKGLTALTAIGRGDRAEVANGLVDRANSSAREAAASAEASAADRAGYAQIGGQALGFGLQQGMKGWGQGSGMTIDPTGIGVNGTGTNLPTAGGM